MSTNQIVDASSPILVVDDDKDLRDVVELALRNEGYEVVGAEHGRAALDLLGHVRPSLILLDMRMPVMDGWQFAQTYRLTPGPHVPIVVVTAAASANAWAREIDADDVLAKPFDLVDLSEVVRKHLVMAGLAGDTSPDLDRIRTRLEAAEAYYARLFTSAPDAILVSDALGRCIDANPAATELLGHSRGELIGLHIADVLGAGHAETVRRHLAEAGAGSWREELDVRCKDHTLLPVEVQAWRLTLASSPVLLMMLRDVRERRMIAATRAAVAAAEEADRVGKELLNMVSHELRAPVAVIKGFTSTLLMHGDRLPAGEQQGFLQEIDAASDRLVALVNDLLDADRLESGLVRIDRTTVSLGGVVSVAVAEACHRWPDRAIAVDVAEAVPPVLGDARRLGQVVTNLLDNALKYSPAGDAVLVRVRDTGDSRVQLSVTDHGIGIPQALQDRIFERFYRVDLGPARAIPGTGLGLAICRRLVEAHGGTITVESHEGEGSTFTVQLPIAESSIGG